MGAKLDRSDELLDRLGVSALVAQRVAEAAERRREARVEIDRPLVVGECGRVLTTGEMNAATKHVEHRIVRIRSEGERRCAQCVVEHRRLGVGVPVGHPEHDRVCPPGVGVTEIRIDRPSAVEQSLSLLVVCGGEAVEVRDAEMEQIPRAEVRAASAAHAVALGEADVRFDRRHDLVGDPIEHVEEVRRRPVIALGPPACARLGLGQRHGHAQSLSVAPDRSLHDVRHTEFVTKRSHRVVALGVRHRDRPSEHSEPSMARQARDHVCGQPLVNVRQRGVVRQIVERQHRNERLIGGVPLAALRLVGTGRDPRLLLVRCDEPIAGAADGPDDALSASGVTDGATDLLDLGRERGLTHKSVTPDRVEQLLLGHDPVARVDQSGQERHGARLQLHRSAIAKQLPPVGVEHTRAEPPSHLIHRHRTRSMVTTVEIPRI